MDRKLSNRRTRNGIALISARGDNIGHQGHQGIKAKGILFATCYTWNTHSVKAKEVGLLKSQ